MHSYRAAAGGAAAAAGWEAATTDYGGAFVLTVHPWISGRGQRIRLLRALFTRILRHSDVWFTTTGEIAAWHKASANFAAFDTPLKLVSTDVTL